METPNRENFLNHFADKKTPQYQQKTRLYPHADGIYSGGYMWEVLRPRFVIHYSTALHLIEPLSSVMAIRDQVRINNKVFCAPCVQCSGLEFNKSLEYGHLAPPLDNLYVFDKTYSWYIAITSEYERHNFWGDTEDSLDYLCFASCNPFSFAEFVKS